MFIGSDSSSLRLRAPAAPTHAAHAGSMQRLCDRLCAQGLPVCHPPASGGALHGCREQVSFNVMAEVTIHSDFGAQENEACHFFHFFPHLFAKK